LCVLLLAALTLSAADVSVLKFSVIPTFNFNQGSNLSTAGQDGCSPGATFCVTTNNVTGTDELFGCPGSWVSNAWLCNAGSEVQMTNSAATSGPTSNQALFSGFVNGTTNYANGISVGKGQPSVDPTGAFLFMWVQSKNSGSTGSCASPSGGSGSCGDSVACSINSTTMILTNCVNITNISSPNNGVLFSRASTGTTTYLWMSYKYAAAFGTTGPSSIGQWEIRAFSYTAPGGVFTLGSEVTAVATATAGTGILSDGSGHGVYLELSGFYDPTYNGFTFQCAAGGSTSFWWQQAICGVNIAGTAVDIVASTSTGGCYDWGEHPSSDHMGNIIWADSHYATTVPAFTPCATSFQTIRLGLDWVQAPLQYTRDGAGVIHMSANLTNIVPLTQVNVLGSADRTKVCLNDLGSACPSSTAYSGGAGGYVGQGQVIYLVKENNANTPADAALFSFSMISPSTRTNGTVGYTGTVKIQ